ncbi:MAG: rRNA large subunit methyltransferase I, partial [Planctomycetota bacterium]
MGEIRIKAGRAKPLWRGHPWVFADSIASVEGDPEPGHLVTVKAPDDRTIGRGFFNPRSAIAVRILTRGDEGEVGREFFQQRLDAARHLRDEVLELSVISDGYRVVHSEGDLLPGLIVESFAGHLVVQFSTLGM